MSTDHEQLEQIPILKHDTEIVNGMMKIIIDNLDTLYQTQQGHEFILSYKFNLPSEEQHYLNATWQSTQFTILSIAEQNDFCVKVPLFLLPYSLEYNLAIKSFDFVENDENQLKEIACITSINYTVQIPSVLMKPTFKPNERVQYQVEHAAYVVSGIILELQSNDMIKIKTDDGYSDNTLEDIASVHVSQVLRYPIQNCFVIDLTNRTMAEIDLILRTKNEESIAIYCELSNVLNVFFVDEMFDMEQADEHTNFAHMSVLIATNIHNFLYLPQYNYKVLCMLGNSELRMEEQWKYFLWRNCNDIKKGFVVSKPQSTRAGHIGYTCDVCRIEINWFEYAFHCDCSGDGHDYCLPCIHSLISQYNTLKPFMSQLLHHVLDENCIDEIVGFCVGKAIKFDIKRDESAICNGNVGSKRRLERIDSGNDCEPAKKRLKMNENNGLSKVEGIGGWQYGRTTQDNS